MDTELRNMVMAFRVTELQNLLGHFNKNKNGRKNELQARALDLVRVNNSIIASKIRELYRSIQLSLNQPLPASAVVAHNQQQQFGNNPMAPGRVFGSSGVSPNGDKQPLYQTRYPNPFSLPGLQVINSHNSRVPICPDVQFKHLPFFDILAQLTRPTSLLSTITTGRAHEANFTFFLSPTQASDIASSKMFNNALHEGKIQYGTQVQIRFCALEIGAPQDDLFPPSMQLKVNNKIVPLPHPIPSNRPGVEPKRPSRPLNVTNFVKNSPTVTNNVNVTWGTDTAARDYVISINLVKKLASQDLLNRLKTKGPRPSDYTKGMIKEMVRRDDADCIASSTFKVSVACPVGKCRMVLPCRAATCKHLQCFDANLYLQMNEKKPVWNCPVCDKYTAFDDLAIDGYFQDVITKLSNSGEDCNEIEVMKDGTWAPLKVKKEGEEPPAKVKKTKAIKSNTNDNDKIIIKVKKCKLETTICLDDDDVAVVISDEDSSTPPARRAVSPIPKSTGPAEVIDLTFTSDEDEPTSKETNDKAASSSSSSSSSSKSADSDAEEVANRPNLRLRQRKKVSYVVEDSSSSSSAESSPQPPPRPVTPPQGSPDCILLDSPTSSPPSRNMESGSGNEKQDDFGGRSTPTAPLNLAPPTSNFSAESLLAPTPSLPFNSITLFGSAGVLPPVSEPQSFQGTPFSSFPAWDNSTAFPSDFSSLEFPSMDYFNQGPSSSGFGSSSGRPGTSRFGGGGPQGYF